MQKALPDPQMNHALSLLTAFVHPVPIFGNVPPKASFAATSERLKCEREFTLPGLGTVYHASTPGAQHGVGVGKIICKCR